ncbi:MAG: DNA-protecting protein DprA [Rhodothermales bacterium]|nr:DNA-protecting protein DprA [Rhodothermales bacterium]MBO6780228.1 DNA-protecting protein DprA [Rhodothermales bacterium]
MSREDAEGPEPFEHGFVLRRTDEDREAFVRLALSDGIGTVTVRALLQECGGSAAAILDIPEARLRGRLPKDRISAILAARDVEVPDRPVLTPAHDDYPERLRLLTDAPLALWWCGRPLTERPRVAMVGSRRVSEYGRRMAARMARDLSDEGIEVVSGMATGIDGAAHRGALEGRSGTMAVMATGINRVFPAVHRALARQIEADGTLLTERPPGRGAGSGTFRNRNRIISGISDAVVVVEANDKGGALLTAALAEDQRRPLWAVPGDMDRKSAMGSTKLLTSRHATPAWSAWDLINAVTGREKPAQPKQPGPAGALLPYLGPEGRTVDQICRETGKSVSDILVLLLDLQLRGVVKELPGKRYVPV